ncbi:flavodoxin [Labilibaculum manganireducens]|uniref:Flavodoxin n=1 Tax=Labilibaculum manganireducens TaxID=1940525 RepID=A0A2N3IDF0_9BACT|nr:flavodoxin [Labilibaculum manganireducens]PKQ68372.1 flavodoxin [Labilibaculum manganireducens]
MQNIGIFYGSSTGKTETAAKLIQAAFGEDIASAIDVASAKSQDVEQFKNLIFGASTWGIGDLQDDFEDFLSDLSNTNLEGRKVAIFGLGDQEAFSDSFVDGVGEIYEQLGNKNCELIGGTSIEGYEYDASRAEKDGQFVGLILDEENQSEMTDERVTQWVTQLKNQFN